MPAQAIVHKRNSSRRLKISLGSALASLLLKNEPPAMFAGCNDDWTALFSRWIAARNMFVESEELSDAHRRMDSRYTHTRNCEIERSTLQKYIAEMFLGASPDVSVPKHITWKRREDRQTQRLRTVPSPLRRSASARRKVREKSWFE